MIEAVLQDTSDAPWSLKGWTVVYQQVGPENYAYYVIDPKGEVHRNEISMDRFWHQYNRKSFEDFLTNVPAQLGREVEKYLLKHGEWTRHTL